MNSYNQVVEEPKVYMDDKEGGWEQRVQTESSPLID